MQGISLVFQGTVLMVLVSVATPAGQETLDDCAMANSAIVCHTKLW